MDNETIKKIKKTSTMDTSMVKMIKGILLKSNHFIRNIILC